MRTFVGYHESESGNPAKCYANEKPCPRGTPEEHFPTKEAMKDYIVRKAQAEGGDPHKGMKKTQQTSPATQDKKKKPAPKARNLEASAEKSEFKTTEKDQELLTQAQKYGKQALHNDVYAREDLQNVRFRDSVGVNLTFRETDLTGASFQDSTLQGLALQRSILRRANLSGAKVSDAVITSRDANSLAMEAHFTRSTLHLTGNRIKAADATLEDTNLNVTGNHMTLEGAVISKGSVLRGETTHLNATEVALKDSRVEGSHQGSHWGFAQASDSSFRGTVLANGDFNNFRGDRVNLSRVDATRSDWTEAEMDFGGAQVVSGVTQPVSGEDKHGVDRADFAEANLQKSYWGGGGWKGAEFAFVDAHRATFDHMAGDHVSFSEAKLTEAVMNGCGLRDGDLSYAHAHRAEFLYSDLRRVNARQGDFRYASFEGSDLRGVDFTGASLDGADFTDCRVDADTLPKGCGWREEGGLAVRD